MNDLGLLQIKYVKLIFNTVWFVFYAIQIQEKAKNPKQTKLINSNIIHCVLVTKENCLIEFSTLILSFCQKYDSVFSKSIESKVLRRATT